MSDIKLTDEQLATAFLGLMVKFGGGVSYAGLNQNGFTEEMINFLVDLGVASIQSQVEHPSRADLDVAFGARTSEVANYLTETGHLSTDVRREMLTIGY